MAVTEAAARAKFKMWADTARRCGSLAAASRHLAERKGADALRARVEGDIQRAVWELSLAAQAVTEMEQDLDARVIDACALMVLCGMTPAAVCDLLGMKQSELARARAKAVRWLADSDILDGK